MMEGVTKRETHGEVFSLGRGRKFGETVLGLLG
jgi:hypothetical protein